MGKLSQSSPLIIHLGVIYRKDQLLGEFTNYKSSLSLLAEYYIFINISLLATVW